jgi:hypothetical protein
MSEEKAKTRRRRRTIKKRSVVDSAVRNAVNYQKMILSLNIFS